MLESDLNAFYTEFRERTCVPTFVRRILFIGRIHTNLQYSLPYILHSTRRPREIYEPFRLKHNPEGTLRSFYRSFGRKENDLFVCGSLATEEDRAILAEIEQEGSEAVEIGAFSEDFESFFDSLTAEATSSNLKRDQIAKIDSRVQRAKAEISRS